MVLLPWKRSWVRKSPSIWKSTLTQNLQDDTELSFNYVDAYTVNKEIVEEQEFNLVETMAETIAEQILVVP